MQCLVWLALLHCVRPVPATYIRRCLLDIICKWTSTYRRCHLISSPAVRRELGTRLSYHQAELYESMIRYVQGRIDDSSAKPDMVEKWEVSLSLSLSLIFLCAVVVVSGFLQWGAVRRWFIKSKPTVSCSKSKWKRPWTTSNSSWIPDRLWVFTQFNAVFLSCSWYTSV